MATLEIDIKKDGIEKVNDFIADSLMGFPMKLLIQTDLVVEEVFSNISREGSGKTKITCEPDKEKNLLTLVFEDKGHPFDPLYPNAGDTSITADSKKDSLGILITKKLMDDVNYEYKNGKNVLTIIKKL